MLKEYATHLHPIAYNDLDDEDRHDIRQTNEPYLVYGFLLPENNRQGILSTSVSEKVRMTLNSKYIETIVRGIVSESEEYTPVLCLFTNHGYPKFTNDQLEAGHGIVKDALELPDDAVAKWYYDDEHHGPE